MITEHGNVKLTTEHSRNTVELATKLGRNNVELTKEHGRNTVELNYTTEHGTLLEK